MTDQLGNTINLGDTVLILGDLSAQPAIVVGFTEHNIKYLKGRHSYERANPKLYGEKEKPKTKMPSYVVVVPRSVCDNLNAECKTMLTEAEEMAKTINIKTNKTAKKAGISI